MVKRKLAAHDNLKITIEQTGENFHVKESSNFRSIEINFTLGVTFEYSLADGTELSVRKKDYYSSNFCYSYLTAQGCTFISVLMID